MNKDGLTFFPHRSHGAKVNQQVLTIEDIYRGKWIAIKYNTY